MKRQSTVSARVEDVVDKKKRNTSDRPCIVLQSPAFAALKKEHQEQVGALYAQKSQLGSKKGAKLVVQREINKKVIRWNETHQIEKNYFDLHGMSPGGAVWYAKSILAKGQFNVLKFETGRGNHSKNGIPAIKMALKKELEMMERSRVFEEPWNQGVLVLEMW